jgi:glycosyltransferase involved in cell wall biosynthesis
LIKLLAFCTNEWLAENPRGWGAETRFRELAPLFENQGIQLIRLGYKERAEVFDDGYDFAIPKNARWSRFRLVMAGIRLARALKCDALYAYHADSVDLLFPTYLVAKICRKPFFVVVHDDAQRAIDSLHFLDLAKRHLREKKRRLHRRLLDLVVGSVRRLAVRDATTCICVSNFAAQYAFEFLHARKVAVAGNGVGKIWFNGPQVPKTYVGAFLGRVDLEKGIDTLLYAWRDVLLKEKGAQLVVVGSVNEGVTRPLVSQLDLKERVSFAGYVSETEAVRLLAASRIFIFPSRQEGFGLAVGQAMALGLPCVVSDIPALVENYQHTALVTPVGNHAALAEAILGLLNNPNQVRKMSEKGREAAAKMKWDSVCSREAEIILKGLRRP